MESVSIFIKKNPITLAGVGFVIVLVIYFVPMSERQNVLTTIAKSAGSSVVVKMFGNLGFRSKQEVTD